MNDTVMQLNYTPRARATGDMVHEHRGRRALSQHRIFRMNEAVEAHLEPRRNTAIASSYCTDDTFKDDMRVAGYATTYDVQPSYRSMTESRN
jgi:hypothetical protein